MTTNPWAWQDGRNPYRSTAFQVLGLGVEVRGRAAIRAHVKTRRQRVHNAPERYLLFGNPLTEADINEAEQRIQDPATRLLDELCTHRPPPDSGWRNPENLAELTEIEQRLRALAPPDIPPEPTLNPTALCALIPPVRPRTFAPLWTHDG